MWRIKVGMAHATEVGRTVRTSLAVALWEKMETRELLAMHSSPSQTASTISLLVVTTVLLAADGRHEEHAYLDAEVIAKRQPPLSSIQNSPGIFDGKMLMVDASDRGDIRGAALPLLLDLARGDVFLHDASVAGGLEELFDPKLGEDAPYPFYLQDKDERAAVIGFQQNLDTARK